MYGKKLVRIDSTSDNEPREFHELAVFVPDAGGKSVHVKLAEFLQRLGPVALNVGYAGQVYPQFKVENVEVL